MSSVGLGTLSATPVQQPGLAGWRVASRLLTRERTVPFQGLVEPVRTSGERALSPADDALVDLEPTSDQPTGPPPGDRLERVAGESLADRCHPADRQISGAAYA